MITFLALLLPAIVMHRIMFKSVKTKRTRCYKVYNVVLLDKSGNPITHYTYLK